MAHIDNQIIHPEIAFGPLFIDVATSQLIDDGKLWADAIPMYTPEEIRTKYLQNKGRSDFDLNEFISSHFDSRAQDKTIYFESDLSKSTENHINDLWPFLKRNGASGEEKSSSLIPLPYPYIVPGGRFNEIYYWDSYFTMVGLEVAGEYEMIESMVENFAWMIKNFGFIPNGNRSYYLSRSQPPFFALMVELLSKTPTGIDITKYLPELISEYQFWTHETNLRSIKIQDNEHLNRYYDNSDQPRTEMYAQDVELKGSVNVENFYTNIKAACESGWDFSTRWLKDHHDLQSICTTDILPVDLNCLLYTLEKTIASAYRLLGESENAVIHEDKAYQRSQAILKYFWDDEKGYFFDYNHTLDTRTKVVSLAGLFPLFIGICPPEQANRAIPYAMQHLLREGGLVTTNVMSGQQWDAPNGWAPLQWISYVAMKNYHFKDEAVSLAKKWISLNDKVFKNTGKMMEKYNVENVTLESGGGEYPVQDGFGWTNGVYLALQKELRNLKD